MHLLIIGAAGMIGRKLTESGAATGTIGGRTVGTLPLADLIQQRVAADFKTTRHAIAADLSAPDVADRRCGSPRTRGPVSRSR